MFKTKTNRRFWLCMALAPLFMYCLVLFRQGFPNDGSVPTLFDFLTLNLGFLADGNIIYDCLVSIFSSSGIIPLLNDGSMILLVSWWVVIKLIHIFVDVLTLLPDITSNFIEIFTRRKDDDKM